MSEKPKKGSTRQQRFVPEFQDFDRFTERGDAVQSGAFQLPLEAALVDLLQFVGFDVFAEAEEQVHLNTSFTEWKSIKFAKLEIFHELRTQQWWYYMKLQIALSYLSIAS